ncbi:phosphotransferase [Photobacterium phosphoreum]|uniref:phosphotransferase n=1 Tax=Photobacterium phosphoreum TaxID=659 RepID=UPI000D179E2B|nr:phosphotransferase [Photobacterium phosphoreum]PSU73427.1 phosphotransferase [Photobacterium phosphoreum]PSW15298.1 phosphotransferase [Photobacterium phosphoreum]
MGCYEKFDSNLLRSLPDTELISASMLTGGLTNRCWKLVLFHPLTEQTKHYVWRPLSVAAQAFGIERQHEYQLLTMISDTGLAPKPFQLLMDTDSQTDQVKGLLVEWLTGMEATVDFSNTALCQLQAKVHQLPVPSWRLDIQQRGLHYWQYINAAHKTPLLTSIHYFFQHQPIPTVFDDCCCHFDLGRYNVIVPFPVNGLTEEAKIIDWEYAAAGDPSLDLAMTIIANELNLELAVSDYCDHRQLLEKGTQFNKGDWLQAVRDWQPWCQYLALLWYYVGHQVWHQPQYLHDALQLQQQLIEYIN